MKRNYAIAVLLMTFFMSCMAQDVKLPAPNMKQQSASMIETLASRHSVREYSDKELTDQDLSNLCWAACGVSRDEQHRTSPTAMNRKEVRLFVFTSKNVYEYKPIENILHAVAAGDYRTLMAGSAKGFKQDFVTKAPVTLLMVLDLDLFGSTDDHAKTMGLVDVGNVSENINLYCQSVGLATVPRATMDIAAICELLKFSGNQMPVINNPVGWLK